MIHFQGIAEIYIRNEVSWRHPFIIVAQQIGPAEVQLAAGDDVVEFSKLHEAPDHCFWVLRLQATCEPFNGHSFLLL